MKIIITEEQYKILNEMGPGDLHYVNIVNHYKNSNEKEKEKIARVVKKVSMTKHKHTTLDTIKKDLLELTRDEIVEIEKELGIYDLDKYNITEDQKDRLTVKRRLPEIKGLIRDLYPFIYPCDYDSLVQYMMAMKIEMFDKYLQENHSNKIKEGLNRWKQLFQYHIDNQIIFDPDNIKTDLEIEV